MAIFTRRGLRLGPKVVPTEPVELDRDHPLAPMSLYLPGVNSGSDLLGVGPTFALSNVKAAVTDEGIGLQASAAGGGGVVTSSLAAWNAAIQNSSIGAHYFDVGTVPQGGNNPSVFAIWYGTQNQSPYLKSSILYGNSRYFGSYGYQAIWNQSGSYHGLGADAPKLGNRKFLFSISEQTSQQIFYDNGAFYNSSYSGPISSPSGELTPITFLRHLTASESVTGVALGLFFWPKSLSKVENFWWDNEPYAMLRPDVRRQYYVAASAIAPQAAQFYSNNSITFNEVSALNTSIETKSVDNINFTLTSDLILPNIIESKNTSITFNENSALTTQKFLNSSANITLNETSNLTTSINFKSNDIISLNYVGSNLTVSNPLFSAYNISFKETSYLNTVIDLNANDVLSFGVGSTLNSSIPLTSNDLVTFSTSGNLATTINFTSVEKIAFSLNTPQLIVNTNLISSYKLLFNESSALATAKPLASNINIQLQEIGQLTTAKPLNSSANITLNETSNLITVKPLTSNTSITLSETSNITTAINLASAEKIAFNILSDFSSPVSFYSNNIIKFSETGNLTTHKTFSSKFSLTFNETSILNTAISLKTLDQITFNYNTAAPFSLGAALYANDSVLFSFNSSISIPTWSTTYIKVFVEPQIRFVAFDPL